MIPTAVSQDHPLYPCEPVGIPEKCHREHYYLHVRARGVLWGQSGRLTLTIYLQLSVKKTENLEYCISDKIIFMDNGQCTC